jgi:hypothetical protein
MKHAQLRRAVNVPVQRPVYVPLPVAPLRTPEKLFDWPGTHILPVGVIEPFPPGPVTIPFDILIVNVALRAGHFSDDERTKVHTPSNAL